MPLTYQPLILTGAWEEASVRKEIREMPGAQTANPHGLHVLEQEGRDFRRARRRAFLRRIWALLRGDPGSNELLSFDEAGGALEAPRRVSRLGSQAVVPVSEIVGSVGRQEDFVRAFSPAKAHLGQRWKRIERLTRQGTPLPPVSLYKIGHDHFVLDGHHRNSVARHGGREWVDAEVTGVRGAAQEGRRRPSARKHRFGRRHRQQGRAHGNFDRDVARPDGPG